MPLRLEFLFFSTENSMTNVTHRWPQSGHFFPKLGHFFPVFEKGPGRPPSPPLVTQLLYTSLKF